MTGKKISRILYKSRRNEYTNLKEAEDAERQIPQILKEVGMAGMKIVVLAGGVSTERDVSLSTGRMIYQALKRNGHQAVLLDAFFGYEGERPEAVFDLEKDWAAQVEDVREVSPDPEQIRAMRSGADKAYFGPNVIRICQAADIVFMALHGGDGENGRIQACFDLMGITYTGTDYVSCALAMDKGITKEMLCANDVATPEGKRLKKGEEAGEEIQFPCMVKAGCGGSSVGVSLVRDRGEYEKALEESFRYDDEVIVERYIKGREFSVAVIGGKALPVIEIAPREGFYDYKNKYQVGSTVETCPALLPADKFLEIQRTAEKVFRVLRMKSYARVDFIMEEDTEKVYCLEANTLPGMTPASLLPQEARAVGMRFEQLCEKIIELSLPDGSGRLPSGKGRGFL